LIGNPVHFPGLAAVLGEGLLEVCGVLRDAGPDVANQDRSAVESVLAVKLADTILEFADLRWAGEQAGFAAGPVEIPLVGFGIVETQG